MIGAKLARGFREAFASRRVAVMIPLGFGSGLPLLLSGGTLTAWMATVGVDLTTIGVFALVSIPYSLKFLWAPLLDRFRLPWLGRRRGWMVATQILLIGAVAGMALVDPVSQAGKMAAAAAVVAFLSASLDIATDAYRTDVLPGAERASGTAVFVAAYRVALIVAGAGALIASDHMPWSTVYLGLAACGLIGIVGTLLAPIPENPGTPPPSLAVAVVEPLREFFTRKSALVLLIIVMSYKVGDSIAGHLRVPFLMETGFSRTEIGAVVKGMGMVSSIAGALIGGGLVAAYGLRRTLIAFGILQASANVFYIALALMGPSSLLLATAIGVDELFGGLGTAAFVALLMTLCHHDFTATQYALLSSASSVAGRFLGAASGWIAERYGWPAFFIITIALAVPAIVLLFTAPVPDVEAADDTG